MLTVCFKSVVLLLLRHVNL